MAEVVVGDSNIGCVGRVKNTAGKIVLLPLPFRAFIRVALDALAAGVTEFGTRVGLLQTTAGSRNVEPAPRGLTGTEATVFL